MCCAWSVVWSAAGAEQGGKYQIDVTMREDSGKRKPEDLLKLPKKVRVFPGLSGSSGFENQTGYCNRLKEDFQREPQPPLALMPNYFPTAFGDALSSMKLGDALLCTNFAMQVQNATLATSSDGTRRLWRRWTTPHPRSTCQCVRVDSEEAFDSVETGRVTQAEYSATISGGNPEEEIYSHFHIERPMPTDMKTARVISWWNTARGDVIKPKKPFNEYSNANWGQPSQNAEDHTIHFNSVPILKTIGLKLTAAHAWEAQREGRGTSLGSRFCASKPQGLTR
ncbi:hypothetical protein EDB86DRAFT_2836708 [Lactarius hatsudake]|nr:hypothetical protein EDB86DRAFT_2836708 [Lactarius hatsudake]